jgi:hypothetical protein
VTRIRIKEVAGYPEPFSYGNTLARPDLELLLRRHDFCIDTADPDASIEAGTVVSFNQVTADDLPAPRYAGRLGLIIEAKRRFFERVERFAVRNSGKST